MSPIVSKLQNQTLSWDPLKEYEDEKGTLYSQSVHQIEEEFKVIFKKYLWLVFESINM